jgi:hypothetical protein
MKKKICFYAALLTALAFLAGGFLWHQLRLQQPHALFMRLDIASSLHDDRVLRIDPHNGDIRWRGNVRRERNRVSGIGGAGFALSGGRTFAFTVPWRGKCGWFSYYDLRSANGGAIAMELRLLRRGKRVVVGRSDPGKSSGYFNQKFDVQRGDRFELHWRGRGRVFVGRPLLYRILPPQERQTIVMLAADTLRGDQVDARVGAVAVAPFLARFADECARFDRCLSPSTWTLPSFSSLFTARNEIAHGMNTRRVLAAHEPFLVEALAGRFITVNFHGGLWLQLQSGFQRGFDIVHEGGFFGERKTVMAKSLLDGTLALLEQAEFPAVFLFLHTYQVHTPYAPPADLLRRLDPSHPALADGIFPKTPPEAAAGAVERERYYRLYQAGVSVLDREIERFFSGLKRTGLYERTMFILFGDHGEAFGEHGQWEHGTSLFNEEIHIPLLMRFPGGRFAGRRLADPVSLLDVFPTVLDWLAIPPPAVPLDGFSLMPVLKAGKPRPQPIVSSLMNCWYDEKVPPQLALSFSRFKIVVSFTGETGGKDSIRAYDLDLDPMEKTPLADLPGDEWRRSLPVIQLHRAYLKKNQGQAREKIGRGMDPETREQFEALGYL